MPDLKKRCSPIHVVVIGGGLAGSEAAWQLAQGGVAVTLYEMRPAVRTVAHRTDHLAELVCSNSLRSDEPTSAIGCLKDEMRALGSLVIAAADAHRVPAGKALAVDREGFSRYITGRVTQHPNITVVRKEVASLREVTDDRRPTTDDAVAVIVATGPLTAEPLAREILAMTQTNALYFYDSLAPLVAAETVDTAKTFRASRYGVSITGARVQPSQPRLLRRSRLAPPPGKVIDAFPVCLAPPEPVFPGMPPSRSPCSLNDSSGGGDGDDYVNCPMDRELYGAFIAELVKSEKVPVHDFEDPKYFEGCLPIEVMAERGIDTLRHGPMKPMGLTDPRTGRSPYAVVQLRQDNAAGTVYNMVGFQTRMKWPEQQRIFRMIPGLERVEFLRLGAMHRNTYLNAPLLLDEHLQLTGPQSPVPSPRIYFAGQITGVEGYVESAAMGLWVGLCIRAGVHMYPHQVNGDEGAEPRQTDVSAHLHIGTSAHGSISIPPQTTALGSLIHHVAHGNPQRFEPNNAHWGLTPLMDLSASKGDRKAAFLARARADFAAWKGDQ